MTKHRTLAVQLEPEQVHQPIESAIVPRATPVALTKLPSVPRQKRWELTAIVGISTLLHVGGTVMAMTAESAQPLREKLPQRVQIQVARPQIPKPVEPKPPKVEKPPEPVRQETNKPRPQPVQKLEPTPQSVEEAPAEPPEVIDTGSAAPAAEDGTLFAGSGGLGVTPPPPPAPPVVAAPPKPAPIIQAREGANYLKNPRPAYPGIAQRNGWEGTTLLRVQVSPKGKPTTVTVAKSSGRDVLDVAAIAAVKSWTFIPATQGNVPIGGVVTVPIVFKLR